MQKISLLLLTILIFYSCKKEEEISTNNSTLSVEDFLNDRAPQTQTYIIDAEQGGQFFTQKGSKVTIPNDAFYAADGESVLGDVKIEMNEIFSKSDMLFSGVFPVSNAWGSGMVLNSGGEFSIEAMQGEEDLRVAKDKFIEVVIPAQAGPEGMQLFVAGPVDDDTSAVDWGAPLGVNDDNWNDTTMSMSSFTFNSADGTYSITLDTLGWANIDAFNWQITYFDCIFALQGITGLDNSNTTAFAIFQGQNAVWPVGVNSWGSIQNDTIFESHLANVPLNLLVISVVNGDLFYGLLSLIPQPGTIYTIDMLPVSSADLDQIIADLP